MAQIVEDAGYNVADVTIVTENVTEENATRVYLMSNLDLGGRAGRGSTEENKWETTANEKFKWKPIGTLIDGALKKFYGIFEGNNYTIKGLYVNSTEPYNGVFGRGYIIKNLTVKDGYIKGASFSASVSGDLSGGKAINCHNVNTTIMRLNETNCSVYGGILGLIGNVEVDGCTNTGKVFGSNVSMTGGIVGGITRDNSTIRNCINNGEVNGGGSYIGGITGYLPSSTIEECTNNGNVNGQIMVGGIVGYAHTTSGSSTGAKLNNNVNNGNVYGKEHRVGGIVGGTYDVTIIGCKNNGDVTGNGSYTGGILGLIVTDGNDPSENEIINIIQKCYNTGKVQGLNNTGGIVGQPSQYKSLIEKCYNLGEVISTGAATGGIVGNLGRSSQIYNCYNIAEIKGNKNVGGIIGGCYGSAGEIKSCYTIGTISGTSKVGGIIGNNGNSSTIENSYYLIGTAESDIGGGTTNDLAKDRTYISTTFVEIANSEETIWKVDSTKNEGWPILGE